MDLNFLKTKETQISFSFNELPNSASLLIINNCTIETKLALAATSKRWFGVICGTFETTTKEKQVLNRRFIWDSELKKLKAFGEGIPNTVTKLAFLYMRQLVCTLSPVNSHNEYLNYLCECSDIKNHPMRKELAEMRNDKGKTLFIFAAEVNNKEAIKCLFKHDIVKTFSDMTQEDYFGKTASEYAQESGDNLLVELIREGSHKKINEEFEKNDIKKIEVKEKPILEMDLISIIKNEITSIQYPKNYIPIYPQVHQVAELPDYVPSININIRQELISTETNPIEDIQVPTFPMLHENPFQDLHLNYIDEKSNRYSFEDFIQEMKNITGFKDLVEAINKYEKETLNIDCENQTLEDREASIFAVLEDLAKKNTESASSALFQILLQIPFQREKVLEMSNNEGKTLVGIVCDLNNGALANDIMELQYGN